MGLYYLEGKIDFHSFVLFCRQHKLQPGNAVFLFPGNGSHHGEKHNLYSHKSGSGLAIPASELSRQGYPVLSLPTTGMQNWSKSLSIQNTVTEAIADLWRASGKGFDLVLPVRRHQNQAYFTKSLNNSAFEPNFWGGVQKAANLPLAENYLFHLNLLAEFLQVKETENESLFLANLQKNHQELYDAFIQGKNMHDSDPWLQKSNSRICSMKATSPLPAEIKPASPATQSSMLPRASTLLILGGGMLAGAGAISLLIGTLALAGVLALSFPPAYLMIAGGIAAGLGVAGLGLFATTRLLHNNNQVPTTSKLTI